MTHTVSMIDRIDPPFACSARANPETIKAAATILRTRHAQSDQCAAVATMLVDDAPLCTRHAGRRCLQIALDEWPRPDKKSVGNEAT